MIYQKDSRTGLKEACGVFGYIGTPGSCAALPIYYGLCSLQHRGQEACGIAVTDTQGPRGNMRYRKDNGLVQEVFTKDALKRLYGNLGVGHVRYSTTGASCPENAQPLVLNYIKGTLALAHNGNLTNTDTLKSQLAAKGAIFHTTTDSEIIAQLIAQKRVNASSLEEAVFLTANELSGAYALVIAGPRKLIGIRDPLGIKPLCLGKKEDSYILASESCALAAVGASFVRDILPGEIVTITQSGVASDLRLCGGKTGDKKHAHCIFEYIYFARLDSTIDKISVYDARFRAGEYLARVYPAQADLVSGVPDSGITAALGYSAVSGIPFMPSFYKNSYMGRTFIRPTKEERQTGVRLKLNVLESVVKGKSLVLVDDSIVRGTTMKNLILMLRQAGVRQVHVRISSPPFIHPCYYGTDVPSNRQLIAASRSPEEICTLIGADSLAYLPLEGLSYICRNLPVCQACFDGHYPQPIPRQPESSPAQATAERV